MSIPEPQLFRAKVRLLDFMRQADEANLINLAAGVPSPEALPGLHLANCLKESFSDEGNRLFAYHHPEGDHELRRLLAERLGRRGVKISGSDIVTTTGCTQALQITLSLLAEPGDVVACEAPAYYGMLELLSALKVRVLPIPVRDENGLDFEYARQAFQQWKPRCLVVCSSLSNPSGATIPEGRREAWVNLCRENGVSILEDDIYSELIDGGAPKPMRAWDDGSTVFLVSSFSKTVAPGLRVGYAVPGILKEEFATRKCQQDLHGAVPTETALRRFIQSGEIETHLSWLRERNIKRRKQVMAAINDCFPKGSRVFPVQGGFMLWVALPKKLEMNSFKAEARKRGVAFAAGDVFFTGEADQSYFRLNCAKASEEELGLGIRILGELLAQA